MFGPDFLGSSFFEVFRNILAEGAGASTFRFRPMFRNTGPAGRQAFPEPGARRFPEIAVAVDGQKMTFVGDGKMAEAAISGQSGYIVRAVASGIGDVERAFTMSKSGLDSRQIVNSLLTDGLFSAEKSYPTALPDAQQPAASRSVPWKRSISEMFGDGRFQAACKTFLAEKQSELASAARDLPKAEYAAFSDAILRPLRENPVGTITKMVHYTGGIPGPHNYFKAAEKVGKDKAGARGLTLLQRIRMIRELMLDIGTEELEPIVNHYQKTILGILETAPKGVAAKVLSAFEYSELLGAFAMAAGPVAEFKQRYPAGKFNK